LRRKGRKRKGFGRGYAGILLSSLQPAGRWWKTGTTKAEAIAGPGIGFLSTPCYLDVRDQKKKPHNKKGHVRRKAKAICEGGETGRATSENDYEQYLVTGIQVMEKTPDIRGERRGSLVQQATTKEEDDVNGTAGHCIQDKKSKRKYEQT